MHRIEVCLDDFDTDDKEREDDAYDGDSPTTLECQIQHQLNVWAAASTNEKWPSAFQVLCSLSICASEVIAGELSEFEHIPVMYQLLGYADISLAVRRTRDEWPTSLRCAWVDACVAVSTF